MGPTTDTVGATPTLGNTNPAWGKNKPPTAGSRPSVRIGDGLANIMGGDITFADVVGRSRRYAEI